MAATSVSAMIRSLLCEERSPLKHALKAGTRLSPTCLLGVALDVQMAPENH